MGTVTIETAPPRSMNVAPGQHWATRHKRKRQTQGELAILLLAAGVPRPIPGDRARATARILFPTNRRRDEGNYRTALEKALGDALAPADPDSPFRWLSDDTPAHFTFGTVTFGRTDLDTLGRRRPAVAIVTLAWGDDLATALQAEADQLREAMRA